MKRRKTGLRFGTSSLYCLYIILMYAVVFVTPKNDAPKFVVKPDSSTVLENSKVSFFCRADGNPLPSILWRILNENVNNPRYTIKTLQNGFSTLRIDPVLMSDSNLTLSCVADNGVRQPIKADVVLTVLNANHFPESFPKVESHPIMKSVEQGKTAHVSCRVTGNPRPKILWLRDLMPIDIRTSSRYSVSTLGNPGALMIQQAREEDQGKYECVARNSYGVVHSQAAQLYVKVDSFIFQHAVPNKVFHEAQKLALDYQRWEALNDTHLVGQIEDVRRVPPYFSYKLEKVYQVLKDGNINLTCVAVGYPMPRVFWKRQSDEVLLNDPQTAPIGKNVLKLTNVESSVNYTCIAVSKLGNIEATTTVLVKPVPEPPHGLTVININSTFAILQWKNIRSDEDNLLITHYILRYREKFSTEKQFIEKVVGKNETNTIIDHLSPYTQYEVMIASGSLLGIGRFSFPLEIETDESLPANSPENVHARVINEDSLMVQWDPPETPNGKIIENIIYYTNKNEDRNVSEWEYFKVRDSKNTATISDLTPEDTYHIRVQSKNSRGYGPISKSIAVITKQGIPGAPDHLKAAALENNRISLAWDKPRHSFNIQGYVMVYNMSENDYNEVQLGEKLNKHIMENLKPSTKYSFRIAAKSPRGMGAFSNMETISTAKNDYNAYVPPEPENVKVEAVNATTVSVTWKEPFGYTGTILGYNVYKEKLFNGEPVDNKLQKAVSIYPKEQLHALITDLIPNTEYSFRVNAENKFGDGRHSDAVKIMMEGLPPSAPIIQSLSLIREETPLAARLEWLPPKEMYGKSVTKYHLWYRPDIHTEYSRIDIPGDSRSIEVKDLIKFREYIFILAAATVDGVGLNTTESLSTPAGIPDSPPLNVRYDIVKGKIIFAWDPPPLDQQNGNITYYRAMITSESRKPLIKNVTNANSIALPMTVKSTSTFKVAAGTVSGLGPESAGLIVYPDASASVSAPTNVRVEATSNSSVVVVWDFDSKNYDSAADGFVVKYIHEPPSGAGNTDFERWKAQTIMDPKARHIEISQLTAHKPYAFCILTVKQSRQGPCSDPPVTIAQLKPHYIATNLRVEYKTSTSVSLRWDYAGESNIEFYVNHTSRKYYLDHNLEYKEMVSPVFRKFLKGTERSILWDNLRPYMEHTFKVGVKVVEKGQDVFYWPREIVVQTDNTGPPFVDKPEFLESLSPHTATIRLKCASEEYGPISKYWIVVVPGNFTQETINNLDSQVLKHHSEQLKIQFDRDGYSMKQEGASHMKKVKRSHQNTSLIDRRVIRPRTTRFAGGPLPTIPYVTAEISAQRMQTMQKEKETFTIGDGKNYDGFENFPLHPSSHYKLMMRAFAKDLENGKKNGGPFTYRAPMNQPRAKKYADSMLTTDFSTKLTPINKLSKSSSLWLVGPIIAVIIITLILGLLVIWWWKFSKKNPSHLGNRHGSITKVALADSGNGNIPNETSKLLFGQDAYGRPIINAYDMHQNGNIHHNVMESSLIDLHTTANQMCDGSSMAYKVHNAHVPVLYEPYDNYQDLQMPVQILSEMKKRTPIAISDLSSHIDQLKMHNNQLFTSEYDSIEKSAPNLEWKTSTIPYNKTKNRYANVVPYDETRVVLKSIYGIEGSDYINANYIDGYHQERAYIATQGPLPETFNDFWRMVWETKSYMIVMLTRLEEMSRIKCDQYWPQRKQRYGMIQVELLDTIQLAHYTVRTFRLQLISEHNPNEIIQSRDIKHMQYTSWPDHGVPDHTTPFLMFLKRVKTLNPQRAGPIISHCSAGIGRTGAFIVIDCMLERLRHENTVDIYGCVREIRAQRSYMVQTDDQYIFIHDAVLDAVQSGSTEIPAKSIYHHIEVLTTLHALDHSSGMDLEFQTLGRLRVLKGETEVATLPINRSKNRSSTIVPYDSSRVVLKMINGYENSDYINASWIDGYRSRNMYIATQSPLQQTAVDFWRMIWETGSSIIVMLINSKELEKDRCYVYWSIETTEQYGNLEIERTNEYAVDNYSMREFKVTYLKSVSKTVRLFQLLDWPDNGVPRSADPFIKLVELVHESYQTFGLTGPIVVHDHLGTGRAGVFIAVSIIIERMKLEHVVDVFTTVKLLRTNRRQPNEIKAVKKKNIMLLSKAARTIVFKTSSFSLRNQRANVKNLIKRCQLSTLVPEQNPQLSQGNSSSVTTTRPNPDFVTVHSMLDESRLMLPKTSLVIFDKDGTLICFHAMWIPWVTNFALRIEELVEKKLSPAIYSRLGYDPKAQKVLPGLLAEATMKEIREATENVLVEHGVSPPLAINVVEKVSAILSEDRSSNHIKEVADLRELFLTLRMNGILVAVCTSDSRQNTEYTLKALNLNGLVDFVRCGDDIDSLPKPHPSNAFAICNALNVHPSETLMVGDTLTDLRMAKLAKLGGSVGVLTGVGNRDLLQKHSTLLIENVAQLLSYLPNIAIHY
uniref:Protein-tyrosine-phosphatase n=1 Tax=Rhabditophanes sp. KR3021 TaxID=114890 RepID=A0AC35U5G8_9BILA